MGIEVVEYEDRWIPAVRAFNQRMEAGGTHWRWYESPVDPWIPEKADGQKTWREHFLAVEDGSEVRGGYALKPHEFLVRGEPRIVTDWQGPITEGVHSRRYNTLGIRLLRTMVKRYPLLYSWGHGGLEQPLLQMLTKMGWFLHGTPFCLRILRPARFLHRNRYLRTSPLRNVLFDVAAATGTGWLGTHALHAALSIRAGGGEVGHAEPFDTFGPWADALWERAAPEYRMVARRDAATLNLLFPSGGWPPAHKLRVKRGDETIGWAAVLDTQMEDDVRFGNLRVGSVIDAFASPGDADAVIGAAFAFLRSRGPDLVFSNQSHPAWTRAFEKHGFLLLPERRYFAASPELTKVLEPIEEGLQGLHLTNLDGHGPMRM